MLRSINKAEKYDVDSIQPPPRHATRGSGRRSLRRFDRDDFSPPISEPKNRTKYAYDAAHNVSQYEDGRGVEVDLADRDGVGRIETKSYTVPGGLTGVRDVPDVTYTYDSNGNLTGISNTDGSASWTYDSLDRLGTESVASGPQITYAYDPRGVITSETVSGYTKLNTTHTYDAVGRRLTTVQDSQTTSFVWDDALRRTKVTLPNGVESSYTYSAAGWPSNIEYKKGTVFENYAYTHDDVGNPTQIVTSNGTYAYGYDSAYRLTSESRTGFRDYSASHTYDAMGNRLTRTLDSVSRTYSYNKADQVTSWTEGAKAGSYTYDIDGNLTQKAVTDGGTATDQWDCQFDSVGRMVSSQQSVGGTKSIANVYAGDQWYRVSSTISGTTMKYGWRGGELSAEFDSSSNLTAGYLNDGVDRPFYRTRFSSNGTAVDGRDFYHADANLRVHHVTNISGNVAEKYVYNGYGRRTILDAASDPLTSSAIGNRIGFQGREHDDLNGDAQEAGLTFHRSRFYDPDVGRWMRRDPLWVHLAVGDLFRISQLSLAQISPASHVNHARYGVYYTGWGRFLGRDPMGVLHIPALYEMESSNPINRTDPKGEFWGYVVAGSVAILAAGYYLGKRWICNNKRKACLASGHIWLPKQCLCVPRIIPPKVVQRPGRPPRIIQPARPVGLDPEEYAPIPEYEQEPDPTPTPTPAPAPPPPRPGCLDEEVGWTKAQPENFQITLDPADATNCVGWTGKYRQSDEDCYWDCCCCDGTFGSGRAFAVSGSDHERVVVQQCNIKCGNRKLNP